MNDYSLGGMTEGLIRFLRRPRLLQHERDWLHKVLFRQQERIDKTLIPAAEEIGEKLGYIATIHERYTSSHNALPSGNTPPFYVWHLSSLYHLPVTELRDLASDMTGMNAFLNDAFAFMSQVLRGRTDVPFDLMPPGGKGPTARREPLRDTVIARDRGKCIITAQTQPLDVCHIIPYSGFATNTDDRARQRRWHVARRMFGSQRAHDLEQLLNGPGCTEKSWNLVTLCKDTHFMWDRDLIAMEPVEMSGETDIRIRIQWFYRSSEIKERYRMVITPSTGNIGELFSPLSREINMTETIQVNTSTAQPVLTGNIYKITCLDTDERFMMYQALQARWDLQRVVFCAGASGIPTDEFYMPPPDEDPFGQVSIDLEPPFYYSA